MPPPRLPLLHPLFSDRMVFPRDRQAPVWGWTAPGTTVRVTLAGAAANAVAGADGRWQALLPALPAGGPHQLVVQAGGGEPLTCRDVLIGEVWLFAGQSNMEFTVARLPDGAALAAATDPAAPLRLLAIGRRSAGIPRPLPTPGPTPPWRQATPETVAGFSAVAWSTGRALHAQLGVPVGVVCSAWAGSNIRAWMSEAALNELGQYGEERAEIRAMAAVEAAGGPDVAAQERRLLDAWWHERDPGVRGGWHQPEVAVKDDAWPAQPVPGAWQADGAVWLRRWIELPPGVEQRPALLRLGGLRDEETVWVNGVRTGAGECHTPHANTVPLGTLRAGRNLIAIHAWSQDGRGAAGGAPVDWRLEVPGAGDFPLAGIWRRASGAPADPVRPRERFQGMNGSSTMLFNGAIAPLAPFAFSGVVWYQGEQDAGNPAYQQLLPGLVADWRRTFADPGLPVVVVQLPAFRPAVPDAVQESAAFAVVRDAQLLAARRLPRVALAVTIDLGDAFDVHPLRKREVGERAAAAALALVHGRPTGAGALFDRVEFAGGVARAHFTRVVGALRLLPGQPSGFALAGADGRWHHAQARIVDGAVEVSAPQVAAPSEVCYGWADNPAATLVDGSGVPASPFRAD